MQRNSGARFLPLFITLVVVIIAVIAVVSIGRAIFFNGNDSSDETSQTKATSQTNLLKTTADRGVKLTVRGPIVADENFTSYTITASPASRTMSVYNGYVDSVRDQKSYENNSQAYAQFVYALDKANMTKGKASDDKAEDLRGICATGYVYEYAVTQNGQTVESLWTSTCGGSKGNLDASTSQLNNLFQKQIPDYNDLTPFRQSPIDGLRL